MGYQGVRAELGAVGKREKDERKAFQVAFSVLGEEAGSVESHMNYQTTRRLQVDHI